MLNRLAILTGFTTLAVIVSGCLGLSGAPVRLVVDETEYYARNILFEVNKRKCFGTCVVPRAVKYEIKAWAKSDFDFLLIKTSCGGRTKPMEGQDNDFTYTYIPTPGVEDNRACSLSFVGVEQSHNRRALGFIDFEDPRHLLPAVVKCNADLSPVNGVGACENEKDNTTRIEFQSEVVVSSAEALQPNCRKISTLDGKNYEWKQSEGDCIYLFMEKAAPNRTLRLTTFGFTKIQPTRVK